MQTLGTPFDDEFDLLFGSRVDSPRFEGAKTDGHHRISKTVRYWFVIVTIGVEIHQEFGDGFFLQVDRNV
ncbi:hypothetical protein A6X21_10170 [Planctopirus hydrillae]|uniref:Uncharacterized protein n=1 Tax=Planctopirus hydrillae TaxID=1841610 RepID=A0A1C3E724_9PLAN|nr:hypothetical protein A6X21_10170 [Planctopirus hydrillae]